VVGGVDVADQRDQDQLVGLEAAQAGVDDGLGVQGDHM
jgi:hypothetical protein